MLFFYYQVKILPPNISSAAGAVNGNESGTRWTFLGMGTK